MLDRRPEYPASSRTPEREASHAVQDVTEVVITDVFTPSDLRRKLLKDEVPLGLGRDIAG